MANQTEIAGLRDMITDLRDYLVKEYSLKTEARSYKGENATDQTLPADWEAKNDAIVGESEPGPNRADAGNPTNTSSTASQSDPYLHKSDLEAMEKRIGELFKQAAGGFMMNEDEMAGGGDGWDDIDDEPSGDMAPVAPDVSMDEMDDDMEQKMGHYKGDEMGMDAGADMGMDAGAGGDDIVSLLSEIKALLANGMLAKQAIADNQETAARLENLEKNMTANVNKQVKQVLQKQNLKPVQADVPKRVEAEKPLIKQEVAQAPQQAPVANIPAHIETDLVTMPEAEAGAQVNFGTPMSQIFGNNPADIHAGFVDHAGILAKSDNQDPSSMEFQGLFRTLNNVRIDQGDLLAGVPAYHYNI